jgi:lysophospholipid acyltransferase (LPLAT)-like uncharacterized protein
MRASALYGPTLATGSAQLLGSHGPLPLQSPPVSEQPAPTADLRARAIGFAVALFVRLLRLTLRVEHHSDREIRRREREGERFLLAFWHRHVVLMAFAYKGSGISVLSSKHRDGEITAQAMRYFRNIRTARGSTTRGAVGGVLTQMRWLKQGLDLAITPDGPKGPGSVAKPGAAQLASLAGVPVMPIGWAASRCWRLKSWDRMIIPKPFARVCFVYGDPFWVPRGEDIEAASKELGLRLDRLELEAEALARRD